MTLILTTFISYKHRICRQIRKIPFLGKGAIRIITLFFNVKFYTPLSFLRFRRKDISILFRNLPLYYDLTSENIRRLIELKTYRGIRHMKKLPVHGQRTHSNAQTQRILAHTRLPIDMQKQLKYEQLVLQKKNEDRIRNLRERERKKKEKAKLKKKIKNKSKKPKSKR